MADDCADPVVHQALMADLDTSILCSKIGESLPEEEEADMELAQLLPFVLDNILLLENKNDTNKYEPYKPKDATMMLEADNYNPEAYYQYLTAKDKVLLPNMGTGTKANAIAKSMYSQVDLDGQLYSLLSKIVHHKSDGKTVCKEDGFELIKSGQQQPRHATQGWKLKVSWKDGFTS